MHVSSASRTAVITGHGVISAAGTGTDATLAALREGRSGLGPLTLFESPRCGSFPVAEVAGIEPRDEPRALSLARTAISEALEAQDIDRDRTGLVLGTTVGGMPESEVQAAHLIRGEPVDSQVWTRHECGYLATTLAAEFGLKGPTATISNACASGAEAIACAAEMLLAGAADAMVAGGTDAICRLTLNGFASLLVVDEHGCRPFDTDRGGMNLGEGAAFVVLRRAQDANEPLAVLAGSGNSCDAYHPTAPEPEGRGAEQAMRAALAGVDPRDIGYINAHGTGTPDNDLAEGRAIRRIFGDDVPPLSSTKRVFGHTLGAAGAIEAVVSVLAIREGLLPGNPGLENLDPECEVDPLRSSAAGRPRAVLSNSFGFGGSNSVLCFTAAS
ncbi:MAG: beta-ketoacyl-[acyl-carrier-protein] synthase family protein [Planctomycetota bacterium]|jgi:3-oxoacyl-(acyl-carrier-protein) synthase